MEYIWEQFLKSRRHQETAEKLETPATSEEILKTPEEECLETKEIISIKPLKGGVNQIFFAELQDGPAAIFKPKSGEKPKLRANIEAGTYYQRERAAYLIDKFLDFNLVPPTVLRQIGNKIGSLQQFIPETDPNTWEVLHQFKTSSKLLLETKKLWLLDFIIWNTDRYSDNILLKNNKIYAIDNGLSFNGRDFRPGHEFYNQTIPPELIEKFQKILADWQKAKTAVPKMLNRLLTKKEIIACLDRLKYIGEILNRDGTIKEDLDLFYDPSSY